jgi:hypothetical protein
MLPSSSTCFPSVLFAFLGLFLASANGQSERTANSFRPACADCHHDIVAKLNPSGLDVVPPETISVSDNSTLVFESNSDLLMGMSDLASRWPVLAPRQTRCNPGYCAFYLFIYFLCVTQ